METENQIVAASLAARAIRAISQSASELYILAAVKEDPTIDGDDLRTIWIERWLKCNENRGKAILSIG